MKSLVCVIFICLLSINLFAQKNSQPPTSPLMSLGEADHSNLLSAVPTAQELADLFISACRGEMNPMDAVALASEKREDAVAGLTELLFNESIRGSKWPDDTLDLAPNKIFPALALETIGTQNAMSALLRATDTHTNPEIRAIALNAIAKTYYEKIQANQTPDKSIIRILIRNADDSTYIGYLEKNTCRIADEGLQRWLGIDFAMLVKQNDSLHNTNVIATKTATQTSKPAIRRTSAQADSVFQILALRNKQNRVDQQAVREYRRQWLQQNEAKLVWNGERKRFSAEGR